MCVCVCVLIYNEINEHIPIYLFPSFDHMSFTMARPTSQASILRPVSMRR